jgi:hypothetical protein
MVLDSHDHAQSIGSRCAPANRQEFPGPLASIGGGWRGEFRVTPGAWGSAERPGLVEVALKTLLINKLQRPVRMTPIAPRSTCRARGGIASGAGKFRWEAQMTRSGIA